MTDKSLTIPTDMLPAWMIAETERVQPQDIAQQALYLEAPAPADRLTVWAADDFEEDDTSFTLQF